MIGRIILEHCPLTQALMSSEQMERPANGPTATSILSSCSPRPSAWQAGLMLTPRRADPSDREIDRPGERDAGVYSLSEGNRPVRAQGLAGAGLRLDILTMSQAHLPSFLGSWPLAVYHHEPLSPRAATFRPGVAIHGIIMAENCGSASVRRGAACCALGRIARPQSRDG
jgi:hypothetical protein